MKYTATVLLFALTVCLLPVEAVAHTGWFIPSNRFSSGVINDVCQDRYGYIWVATDYGVNKFDGYRFTTYLHHRDDSTSISSNIVDCLYNDTDGSLWMGTARGLDRYDHATGQFIHYPFAYGAPPRVTKLMRLDDGRLIVGTSGYHGTYVLKGDSLQDWDETGSELRFVNSMVVDVQGRFWQCGFGNEIIMKDRYGLHRMVSTQGFVIDFALRGDEVLIVCLRGIHSYRNGELTVADIDMEEKSRDVIFRSVYTDRQGNIFIGTRGDGLFRIARDSRRLERVEVPTRGIDLNTAKVWAIAEDRLGNLWLGCQSKGLLMLQRRQAQFESWSFSSQGIKVSSTVTSVCEGDDGMIWCTVQGNGVFGFDSIGHIVARPMAPASAECIFRDRLHRYWIGTDDALYAYDPLKGQSQRHLSFDCDKLATIIDDEQGRLYISTFSKGMLRYDPATGETRYFSSNQKDEERGWLCNNWVMAMMSDSKGRIWIATSSGFCCYDPKADSFRPFGWHQQLDGTLCYSLCETQAGDILIGTENGMWTYHPDSKEVVPFADGLGDKVVGAIIREGKGDLWCATSMGIWQWNASKHQFIGHVNGNGLTEREYLNGVGLRSSDGRVFFANNDGLTVFRPKEVTGSHTELPEVSLTNFMVAGKAVDRVMDTDHFRVSYLDNMLSLEFSLMDYNTPSNIVYEYRIGDSVWMQNAEGQNSIMLSRLQPGTYHIEVRAMASGLYSPTKTVTIEVTPPWYRSWVAYLLYILLLLGLVGLIGWMWRRKEHIQLDEEKMQFLINATHDIRSPLTLIMGAVKKLKDDASSHEAITTIDRNAHRLLTLVGQILDERRIDKDQLQLHCRETNLVDFISGICKLYQFNATQRNITFTFEHDKAHVMAWVDRINFDKVVSNLLSNAFKYTYDGGEVTVALREGEREIEILVNDNGIGLHDDDLSHLFDRFYQGRNADSMGMQGTGIGLNLCRNIVQLHGGNIRAQHGKDGSGACFVVTLQKGKGHLSAEQIVTDSPARQVLSSGKGPKVHPSRILIVDDDAEIASYIMGELGDKYKFVHSPNGKEALKTLLTESYDLVISDVMMPEMDGLTLLKRIKENPAVSAVPVIMLTSKAAISNKLEGLKSGADAYIAKPFDMEELHIQIDNLIDQVRRLRGKFSGALDQEERVENIEVKGNDEALMDRIMRSVNAHMSDPEYNVDSLAADVGISRAQLHRRMKEMTGVPTGKFLRNLRMEQAARLLREGKVNVSQIADKVGYNDLSHFSTAFKLHFGMSPTEYAEAMRKP